MIKDFDKLKIELRELAGIINSFKSEAVQLKIVELLFNDLTENEKPGNAGEGTGSTPKRKARKAKKPKAPETETSSKSGEAKKKKPSASGRPGPKAMIETLLADDFFKKGKIVSDIVSHCKKTMGYSYTTSELAPAFTRLIRDKKLTREQNAENQFVYIKK
ncbi:MAG: hypothetical protein WA666_04095 [Nitrospirota bacterium]